MIKVAIDSGSLISGHSIRGIGVMVREQIEAIKSLKDKKIKLDVFGFSTNCHKLINNQYDIIHYPYLLPFFPTFPKEKYGKKVIVTIQDLIYLIYPKHYPPGIRRSIYFWRQKQSLKKVDAIITVSETSKKDIIRFLGIPSDKVFVVYLAAKKNFKKLKIGAWQSKIRNKYKLPKKFALYVGDINYNKNILNLIKACRIAKTPLVICGKNAKEVMEKKNELRNIQAVGIRDVLRFILGKSHPETSHFEKLIKEFKKGKEDKRIILTGFVPESDLVAIYNLASVYIQPSFYEGFGFPVLEAMACGCPVVVARTNSLVEIAGGAALIADSKNPKKIAEKIIEILENKETKEKLIESGFENVKKFSWENTAKEMVKIYRFVADSNLEVR